MKRDENEEESDLFSVKPYTSGYEIPVIEKVPLTPEEQRRRKIMRVLWALLAIATVAGAIWLGLYLKHVSEVDDAVTAASSDGRVASIERALALMEDDGDAESMATKLRLRSMLVLAGSDVETEPIAAALRGLPSDDADVGRERGIAMTYLALAAGDLDAAMEAASGIQAAGSYAAEAARARALAARAVGNVETALSAAGIAKDAQPDSPVHVALFAELTARNGDTDAALARLDRLPDASVNAASRIARARIMDQAGVAITEVAEQADAVLEDDAATAHERAWARLLKARAAASAGDRLAARGFLDEANEAAPPGDELFTLALTEAALRLGAVHLAAEVSERLPSPLSVDAGRRAQLSAEIHLARHDLRAADAALTHAPDGSRTTLAQGRLLQARGHHDEARRRYETAAEDAAFRVSATNALAAMELSLGNAQEAVDLVEPLLEAHPNHPDVVPIAVEARVGLQRADEAMELVTPALAQHPRDARLLAARAHVQMALERWEAALATLDEALTISSDDEELHADRGRAARHLGRMEVAREAFDRALELSPSHPEALAGRLELDLLELSPRDGRAIMDRLDEAEVTSLAIERLRGRLLVMEIAGRSGLEEVQEALETHEGDASLRMSLGWLLQQAEQYAQAVRHLSRLMDDLGEDAFEATLARSLAQARMRASAPARAVMDNIVEDTDEETLTTAQRGELHAVLARLAWSDDDRVLATREATRALEVDPHATEANLVLAEIDNDREQDPTAHYRAALDGPHPHSRPLASLAIREEAPDEAACEYARRYLAASPTGTYARGAQRVRRDCRADDE